MRSDCPTDGRPAVTPCLLALLHRQAGLLLACYRLTCWSNLHPVLLDIRHAERGYYVLHLDALYQYRCDAIDERTLRSLLSQRLMLEMEPRLGSERKVPPARQGRLRSFDDYD